MTKTKTKSLDRYWSPIPNNPQDNQLYIDKKEKRDEAKFNRERMLFDKAEDTLSRIISKREPGEPKKTEYPKIDKKQFDKDMKVWKQRSQQALSRDRLKKKGAVPTKSGKKLFEEFCREEYKNKKETIDDADLRNIYNAATQLEYDDWLWWIIDEYQKED